MQETSEWWQTLGSQQEVERPLSQFAQEEIVIPNGPFAGQYFNLATQPVIAILFAAIESGLYQRFGTIGPTQSGKTLGASVIPTVYSLFECVDDVVYGAPTILLAKDKWSKDFAPVIKKTRYAKLMPVSGTGSRGGTPTGIDFLNGASLRFMTGGSDDKGVAGYTARVISVTEVDGMDSAKASSREADRISQLEVRGDAYGLSKRVYLECTASITQGRIWQEYLNGTHTVIVKPCPYCAALVCPERGHIQGWSECTTERQVLQSAYFVCPACQHPLTAKDRVDMVHNCQEQMDNPDSLTYSIRWNAFDNLFWTVGEIGLDEWRAEHKPEHQREDAIKVQHQFKWALPYDSVALDPEAVVDLDAIQVSDREQERMQRGIVPDWAKIVTVGVDVHAKLLYWAVVAWDEEMTGHVVDYGRFTNPYKDYGQEQAVKAGIFDLRKDFVSWQQIGRASPIPLDLGLIDSSWLPEVVRQCVTTTLWPAEGLGTSQTFRKLRRAYSAPQNSRSIAYVGDGYHLLQRRPKGFARPYYTYEHDVDYGKTWIHRRLATPLGQPGRISFFYNPDGHDKFIEQLTAEKQVVEKGQLVWRTVREQNHWLDAMVLAGTAYRILMDRKKYPSKKKAITSTGATVVDLRTR